MSTRAIRTSTPQTACDVCGRTLLRGERAEIYLAGGDRHSVCELCTSRALHGGWVREGTVPDYGPAGGGSDRRRSLLGRRRGRRRPAEAEPEPDFAASPFADDPFAALAPEPDVPIAPEPELAPDDALAIGGEVDLAEPRPVTPDWPEPAPRSVRRPRRRAPSLRPRGGRDADREPMRGNREPRHVHAVPTSVEHRIDATVELFNGSEHPRTVAGIARSLGLPDVAVHPTSPVGAIVNVIVAWELCWYRYEVDLSAEVPTVRSVGQGYEPSELTPVERDCNAVADDHGRLSVR